MSTARSAGAAHKDALPKGPPGVAPAVGAKLAKLGLRSRFDLILHLPLRYEDETRVTPIATLVDGVFAQVEGVIESADIQYRPRRMLVVKIADDRPCATAFCMAIASSIVSALRLHRNPSELRPS